ncbi:MAG: hypothetical protein NTZ05_06280 [Chloroflexi bacterium]|nr:hypothetical protein [Chloroflexota bacterium]
MSADRILRLVLAAAAMLTLTAIGAACTSMPAEPPQVGAPRYRLTVSPQEPAAGITAEVTVMRIGDDGKPLHFNFVMPVPQVRARSLEATAPAMALPRTIDNRGAWLYDLVFTAPGRWQVAFAPATATATASPLDAVWPVPPVAAPAILRDAVGDDGLSLALQVAPDRGPILWWLRTHPLEFGGFVLILIASVGSYIAQQRRRRTLVGSR